MRHPLPRVLTCATLALAVRDFAVHNELRRDGVPDGYDDFFTHLHVTPETHRAILPEHGDAGVTLSVVFALHPVANVLGFSLPPGYVLTDTVGLPSPGCPQVFAPLAVEQKSPFANETKAKLLTEHITSCEVTSGLEATGNEVEPADDVVMLTLSLAPNVQGLSSRATSTDRNDSEVNPMTWWYFHIRVLYPDRTPEPEDNKFLLRWSSPSSRLWEGEMKMDGWPVLGDWGCLYSQWEGWGSCSTRCGGGHRLIVRRPLLQPPSGEECKETVHPNPGTCNEHPCLHHCDFKEETISGECSAECGGGVKFTRKRFFIDGDNFHLCPQFGEKYSEQLEPCNTQPCKARCQLSQSWDPVTPCDAVCGKGHFKVMKKVLQKEADDETCIPEYKWLPCERQQCTQFTVSRTSPHLVPVPEDRLELILSWAQTTLARKITIRAPNGYQFGEKGEACKIKFHSLQPHMESCKVMEQPNSVELIFATPLPPAALGGAQRGPGVGRYEMAIVVETPHCTPQHRWVADPIRNEIFCKEHPDRTRWEIQFLASEGDAGAEIKDALGFMMQWKEGIPIPTELKLKAEPLLLDEPPPSPVVETTLPPTAPPRSDAKPHMEIGKVLCTRDRDPGYCEDRTGQADVVCGWQNVCQVRTN